MFQKAKYTAFTLFSIFVLRIFLVSIALFTTAEASPVKTFAIQSAEVVKRGSLELTGQNTKADMTPAEVSEESTESDTSENLEKVSKYPSLLLAFDCNVKQIERANLSGLQQSLSHKQSLRTYLSISVLRI
jgi:hypothetical protein